MEQNVAIPMMRLETSLHFICKRTKCSLFLTGKNCRVSKIEGLGPLYGVLMWKNGLKSRGLVGSTITEPNPVRVETNHHH